MTRRSILAGFAASFSTLAMPRLALAAAGYDILVVMGQSNGVGRGLGPYSYADPPKPGRIYQVFEPTAGDYAIVNCQTDLTDSSYQAPVQGVCPWVSWMRRYAAQSLQPGRSIVLVNGAVGGSSIQQWGEENNPAYAPVGDLYPRLRRRVRWALNNLSGQNRVVAYAIQNAETDILYEVDGDPRGQSYGGFRTNMRSLITRARSDLGYAPVTIGEPVRTWLQGNAWKNAFITVMDELSKTMNDVAFVRSAGFASNATAGLAPGDDIHFSAQGAVDLGRKHATAFLQAERRMRRRRKR